MTDWLTINGVAAPLGADGVRESETDVSEQGRALSGAYLGTRIAGSRRRVWNGELVTTDQQLAWCLRRMLRGDGFGWSFATNLRDDWKGNQGWNTDHATRVGGGKYASDGLMRVASGYTTAWLYPSDWDVTQVTVSLWTYESAAWHHYVKIYDTATVWKDGTGGVAAPAWLTLDVTGVTLAASGADRDYCEIVIWPFKIPSTWPALISARELAMVKPPFLGIGGLLTSAGEAPAAGAEKTCRGSVQPESLTNRGASDPLRRFEFELSEK